MRVLAYTSILNTRELNEFVASVYELALAKTIGFLAKKLDEEKLGRFKEKLESFSQANDKKAELLALIKKPDVLQSTADKVFSEHFKALEEILPGFNREFFNQLQKVMQDLNEVIEI